MVEFSWINVKKMCGSIPSPKYTPNWSRSKDKVDFGMEFWFIHPCHLGFQPQKLFLGCPVFFCHCPITSRHRITSNWSDSTSDRGGNRVNRFESCPRLMLCSRCFGTKPFCWWSEPLSNDPKRCNGLWHLFAVWFAGQSRRKTVSYREILVSEITPY